MSFKAAIALAVAGALGMGCGEDTSGAYARVVNSPADLVTGPAATGDVGDVVIGNSWIRVVISRRRPARGLYPFTGAIIDAALNSPGGTGDDQLDAVAPLLFVHGFDPSSERRVTVASDGSDGNPAVVRVESRPGSLLRILDGVSADTVDERGLLLTTDYILESNARHLRIESTLENVGSERVALGANARQALDAAGSADPGDLDLPLGDIFLFGARNRPFAAGRVREASGDLRGVGFDVEDASALARNSGPGLPALPGIVTDLAAAVGRGVSYGLAVASSSNNYAARHDSRYTGVGQAVSDSHSMVLTYASRLGATVHHTSTPDVLDPGEKVIATRYFIVGNGDVASLRGELARLHGPAMGEIGGELRRAPSGTPVSDGEVVFFDSSLRPYTHAKTDRSGRFRAKVPPGTYYYKAIAPGAPAHPSGDTFLRATVTVEAGQGLYLPLTVGDAARIQVRVRDTQGRLLPAKVSVVGTYEWADGGDPRTALADVDLGERFRPTDLDWANGAGEGRYLEASAATNAADEVVVVRPTECSGLDECSVGIRGSSYDVVISHGPEFTTETLEGVQLHPGQTRSFDAVLERVVDTVGYVAADLDVKTTRSLEGVLTVAERLALAAAEGVEVINSGDENRIGDGFAQTANSSLSAWVRSFDGYEMVTAERGHFSVFTFERDPARTNGLAPGVRCIPGATTDLRGFDTDNGETCSLPSIFNAARSLGRFGEAVTVLIGNHPRRPITGFFEQFNYDGNGDFAVPSLGNDPWRGFPLSTDFRDGALDPASAPEDLTALSIWHGKLSTDLYDFEVPSPNEIAPELRDEVLFAIRDYTCGDGHPANALGGKLYEPGGDIAFAGPVDDWYRWMATTGLPVALGASGGGTLAQEIGAPRSWLYVGEDGARGELDRRIAGLLDEDLVLALLRKRIIVSNGPFLELKLRTGAIDSSDYLLWNVGELVRYASAPSTGARSVTALVELRSPPWMRVEKIRIRANGVVVAEVGVPDRELQNGKRVDEGWLFPFELVVTEDAAITAEAVGSQNLFPIITPTERPVPSFDDALDAVAAAVGIRRRSTARNGFFGPSKRGISSPFAITNPVLVDFDGSGAYNPPGVDPIPGPAPDVECDN